jgi:hypothetical protein
MICPHCQANLLYREREGNRCAKCKRVFALEPKANPLHLHDLRFRRLNDKLSEGDTLYYTVPQLLYQASRKQLEVKKAPYGCMVGGLVLASFFIFLSLNSTIGTPISLMVIGVVLALGWWLLVLPAGHPARYLKLPMDLRWFEREVLARWAQVYGVLPPKLLDSRKRESLPDHQPPPDQMRAALACPEPAVLDCLRANGLPERFSVGALPTTPPFTQAEEGTLKTLRTRSDIPLLILHDASVPGVLLPQTVKQTLGLSDHHRIIDLGLRPNQVIQYNLMRLGAKPSAGQLKRLEQQIITSKVLPGQVTLSREAFDWLKLGYTSPILALTPNRLIKIVTGALERVQQGAAPIPTPEQQVQALGYMSWPE